MPQIGEIKGGQEVGYKYSGKVIWHACIDCGKERWVAYKKGLLQRFRCLSCSQRERTRVDGTNLNWEPRHRDGGDYIQVYLLPTDFFYAMTKQNGYVLEHRLIMAKHLGRNLHLWEIVHHKNHKRDDNRIENLQLISIDGHNQLTIMENKVDKLLNVQRQLREQIRLLKLQNNKLKEATK